MSKVFLLAVAVAVGLSACTKEQAQQGPMPTPEVGAVTLQEEPLTLTTRLPGRTTAVKVAEVRPQVSGIIESMPFTEGSDVAAGDLLYQIDPSVYQAAYDEAVGNLESARAAVEIARLTNERYDELLQFEGVSKQEADQAKADYQQAKADIARYEAAVESARVDLEFTKVKAPISGRIGISSVSEGALVTAEQTDALSSIRTLDPIYVDFTQSSKDRLKLRQLLSKRALNTGKASVSLLLEDGSRYDQQGELKLAEVAVDEETGSVTLRAVFPNPDGILLPGMYVRAELAEAQIPDAILAPQQGVTRDTEGNATALVLGDDDKVKRVNVEADRAIGNRWWISSGLAAGDRLIVEGTSKVSPGADVKIVDLTEQFNASAAKTASESVGG